jgi:hypothetical protein
MSYYLHLKSQNMFKGMSVCLQASFVCCKYVMKYATEHLLRDIKKNSHQMFSFSSSGVCRLLVNTCLSAFSLCQCTLVLLFSMPKTDCMSQRFLLIMELWGTWVSGNFRWNSRGHLWWDEFLAYVSINMFNATVCCNLNFTPLQRETMWSVISRVWLTGRECDVRAYAEIVVVILL